MLMLMLLGLHYVFMIACALGVINGLFQISYGLGIASVFGCAIFLNLKVIAIYDGYLDRKKLERQAQENPQKPDPEILY
jgi:hypothetical protein